MSQWPGQPVSGQQEQQWPGQPVTVSRRTTANQAFPEGIRLTEAQRRAYAAIPDLDISGQSGTRQRPFALPANDDGSNMQVGTFGITADGRLVEGRAPRPVALGGGPSPDDIQGMLETFPFGRRYNAGAFRNRLQNDATAQSWRQRPSVPGAVIEQFANSAPFGQGPRIVGFGEGLFAGVPEAVGTGNLGAIPEAIRTRTDQQMTRREMIREQMPVSSLVGEIGGGVAGGVVAGRAALGALGAAAQGTSRAAPAAQAVQRGVTASGQFAARGLPQAAAVGAAAGAPAGAIWGLGERDPVEGAVQGAVGGAIGGAVAPYVARGGMAALRAGRRTLNRIPGVGRAVPTGENPQVAAARELQRVFAREGVTPEQIAQVTQEMQAAGLPNPAPLDVAARLGVMGPILRTQGYGRATPEGRTALANYAEQVRASFGTNVANEARRASRLRGSRAATGERLNEMRRQEQADLMAPVNGVNPNQLRIPLDESVLARLQGDLPRAAVRDTRGVLQQTALDPRTGLGGRSAAEDLATLNADLTPGGGNPGAFTPEQSRAFADMMNVRAGAMVPPPQSRLGTPLIEMIKRLGGISERRGTFNDGEVQALFGRTNAIPGLIRNRTGLPIDDMADRLRDLGYFGEQRASGLDMSSTAAQAADLEARGSDLIDLLGRWQRDPDLYRFGQDEVYQSEYLDWAERLAQADEAGITGPAAQARANAAAQAREAMRPIELRDLEAAAQAGAPIDRTLSVDAIERLRDAISTAEGREGVAPSVATALGQLRRDLVDPARGAVPQYGETLDTGSAYRRQADALEAGRASVLGRNPDEVRQMLAPMAGPERMRFAQGVSESIADRFAPLSGGGVGNTPAIAANPQVGGVLDMVYGPQRAERMRQNLGDLARRYRVAGRIDPQSGSTTADNLASEAEAMSGAASFAFGGPVTRAQQAMNFLGSLRGMRTPQEQAAFIQMMTQTGQLTPELMQELARTPMDPQLRALIGIQLGVSTNSGN